jgi:molecular chaperone GrpE
MNDRDALKTEADKNEAQLDQYSSCSCCCEDEPEVSESSELKKAIEERNEYLSLAQRVQADFENYKKRNRNAVLDAFQSSRTETIALFIPVLDNIDRALESVKPESSAEVLFKGVDMVAKQFKDVLRQLDVCEIEALNKEFDPNLHEAILKVEAGQNEPKNIVVEVLQKGYKCKDKVIRHSLVKVSC